MGTQELTIAVGLSEEHLTEAKRFPDFEWRAVIENHPGVSSTAVYEDYGFDRFAAIGVAPTGVSLESIAYDVAPQLCDLPGSRLKVETHHHGRTDFLPPHAISGIKGALFQRIDPCLVEIVAIPPFYEQHVSVPVEADSDDPEERVAQAQETMARINRLVGVRPFFKMMLLGETAVGPAEAVVSSIGTSERRLAANVMGVIEALEYGGEATYVQPANQVVSVLRPVGG